MIRFSDIPLYDSLSQSEKKDIINLIVTIRKTADKARREGILAIEDELCVIAKEYPFYAEILQFVTDGFADTEICILGMNLITSTHCSDFNKLKMQIAVNGALGIQCGNHPYTLVCEILSMLGFENYSQLKAQFIKD